jgi:hypothetical protein
LTVVSIFIPQLLLHPTVSYINLHLHTSTRTNLLFILSTSCLPLQKHAVGAGLPLYNNKNTTKQQPRMASANVFFDQVLAAKQEIDGMDTPSTPGSPELMSSSSSASIASLQTPPSPVSPAVPDAQLVADEFVFAFDIDGVLVRGGRAIPEAIEAMKVLNGENEFGVQV